MSYRLILILYTLHTAYAVTILSVQPNRTPHTGNTLLTLQLTQDLPDNTTVYCYFRNEQTFSIIARVESDLVYCRTPDLSTLIEVFTLEVSLVLSDSSETNSVSIKVVDVPKLILVSPSYVIQGVPLTYEILGSGMIDVPELKVRFITDSGSVLSVHSVTYLSETQINLNLSILDINSYLYSSLILQITHNLQNYSGDISLNYYSFISLGKLNIYKGPYLGGYSLHVTGSGFIEDLYCMFGQLETVAIIIDQRNLQCTVPHGTPGKMKFQLKLYDVLFDSKAAEFEMMDLLEYKVEPEYLFINHSRKITLIGDFSAIDKHSMIECYISSSLITASFLTSSEIECDIPIITTDSTLKVDLYIDGLNYSGYNTIDHTIYILSPLTLLSLFPTKAPSIGGTSIEISLSSVSSFYSMYCKFGEYLSVAVPISSTLVSCITPRMIMSEFLSVSLVIQDVEATNKLMLSVYKDVSIYEIEPYSGPAIGNTEVSIRGNGLSGVIRCRFGNTVVNASAESDKLVKCNSPAGIAGKVIVEVSANLVDYSDGVEFVYYSEFVVNEIHPSKMQNTGGAWVNLYGKHFIENMMCKISDIISNAVFISETHIQCITPSLSLSSPQYIPISLSGNSLNYQSSSSLPKLYIYPPLILISQFPSYGYPTSIIFLTLLNLLISPELSCKISGNLTYTTVKSNVLSCTIPDLPSGISGISVSNNGLEYIPIGTINILDKIIVSSISPQYSLTSGNLLITITAYKILNTSTLSCKFEHESGEYIMYSSLSLDSYHIVLGRYIDSSSLTCITPQVQKDGVWRVYVSNNAKNWSDSYGEIIYRSRCIDGYECSGGLIKVCPKGYYCSDRMWYQAIACQEGSYQDETGQVMCKHCPVGHYCPSRGLQQPVLCPQNKVCKELGLVYATDDCPRGFTCEAGTTVDTFISDSTNIKPKLCSLGTYCGPEGNISCTPGYICTKGSKDHYGQSPCPPGFYCASNQIFFCPSRTYCPGYANTAPTPCPAGTYNSFISQTICSACPLGYVCPHSNMFEPQACPPGYICDTSGLSFPQKLCIPGYYCEESVQTTITSRPCIVINPEEALDSGFCGVDEMILKEDSRNTSKDIEELGNGEYVDLCCWSSFKVAEYFMNVTEEFESIAEEISVNDIVGISFYSFLSSTSNARMLTDMALPVASDKDLLYLERLWVYQATYGIQATICPAGVFCLEGVTTPEPSSSIRTAHICNPGTYCKEGASTPYGTALCPQGYYCPEGVSDPIPASPGYVTSFSGNVEATACNTGYFANSKNTAACLECPSGYECNGQATVWPTICKNGYYRRKDKSNQCASCPIGTWSWEYGLVSESECFPCLEGRLCITAGAYNATMSVACQEGAVCDQGISVSERNQCVAGYVCGLGTTPEESYSMLCPAGFFCKEGTAKRNQYLLQCPDYVYCPEGSPDFEYHYSQNITITSIPPTVCPIGTGRDKLNGKKTLLDCTMNTVSYIHEVNPLNSSMIPVANYTISSNELFYIFYLHSREVALITMDLRHLDTQIHYKTDWEISITVSEDKIQDSERASPADMPNIFLDEAVNKSGVHEFSLMAWKGIYFKISVLIHNGLFLAHDSLFRESTSVEIFTPNRANYGTDETYLAVMTSDTALPMNVPRPDYSTHLLSYALSPGRMELIRQPKELNQNWFVPNTRFWKESSSMALPYLPYFSNCQAWGAYIPIWAVIEISKECDLVAPEDTKPVQVFGFGTSPSADSCTDVLTECIYDEYYLESQPKPRWWEHPLETPLFYLTPDPVSASDFIKGDSYMIENLVAVTLKTVADSDSLPSEVMLEILYYQIDDTTKRIIEANLYFQDFTKLTTEEKQSNQTISYILKINYRALNHRELMIRFVFPLDFYMALNVIVGSAAVILCSVLIFYHRILTKSNPVPKFKFWSYLVLMMPAPLTGLLFAMIPIVCVLVLLTVLLLADIFTKEIPIIGTDPQGEIGMFDSLAASYNEFKEVPNWDSRMGRCGVSLIIIGIYLLILGATIFIPAPKTKKFNNEDPIGNIWNKTTWKRANFIFLAFVMIITFILLIQFSFSKYWSIHIWAMFVMLQILGQIYEYICEKILGDKLLLTPFLQSIEITYALVTFGTANYLDYVQAYYIDYVIMVCSRMYLTFPIDWVIDNLENLSKKLSPILQNFSNIKSFTRSLRSRSINSMTPSDLKSTAAVLSSDNPLLSSDPEPIDINSPLPQDSVEQVIESYELSDIEETDSYYTIQNIPNTPPPEQLITEVIHEQDIEKLLETYNSYTVELFALLYGPFFIGMLWNFYEPIQIIANYGIKREDFILYFLFAMMMLPFQIVLDVFLHNCYEYFNGWAIHDFIDYMNHKFQDRKYRWADLDGSNETAVENKNRGLYRLCFSSQYYFMCTIFASGILICMLGVETVIVTPNYNLFDDKGMLLISMFVIGLCVLFHVGFYMLGNLLGIWKLKRILPQSDNLPEPEPIPESEENQQIERLMSLFDQLYRPKEITRVVPEIPNWIQVNIVKSDDEIIRRELNTPRLTDSDIRDKFLQVNLVWLQKNLRSLFTPQTIQEHRGMIISKFRKMYGDIEPEILTERSEESYQELPKIQVSTTASSIARYWLSRAKRNRKLFSQIYSIIYSMKEERCIVCGSRFGLQSELIQNVEDLFMQFKREQADDQKYRLHYWNVEYWQEFVKHHGLFRTICLTCLEKVENFNAESAAKQRKQGYVRFVNFKIPATSKLEIDQCTRDIGKIWLDLVRNKVIK